MTCGRAINDSILGDRFMHGSIQSSVSPPILRTAVCALLALGMTWSPDTIFSADAPALPAKAAAKPAEKTAAAATASSKPASSNAAETKKAPSVKARRVEFVSAMILWFAILLAGLVLLAMVMIWGRRVRNSIRRRPPASTVPDPLWYLKKNPKAVAHANQADQTQGPESGPESEGQPSP